MLSLELTLSLSFPPFFFCLTTSPSLEEEADVSSDEVPVMAPSSIEAAAAEESLSVPLSDPSSSLEALLSVSEEEEVEVEDEEVDEELLAAAFPCSSTMEEEPELEEKSDLRLPCESSEL